MGAGLIKEGPSEMGFEGRVGLCQTEKVGKAVVCRRNGVSRAEAGRCLVLG